MARIQPLSARQSLWVRVLDAYSRRRFGKPLTSVGLIARSPGLMVPYLMTSALAHGKMKLPEEIRSLAMHAVAVANGCDWCIDFGLAESRKRGVDPEKLAAVAAYATDPRFSAAERAALAYAAAVTDGHGHVPDETFAALRPHFSDREIVELTTAIAIEHFFNRVNGPLGISEQGFCHVPYLLAKPAATTAGGPG